MKCPYCGDAPVLVTDVELYGQSYGGKRFWLCRRDRAYVGCHPGGARALGNLANAETREWRNRTHRYIDPLWQSGRWTRGGMYKALSKMLGWEVHVGESSVEQCKSIIYAAKDL